MLTTDTFTVADARAELSDTIDEIDAALADADEETDEGAAEAATLRAQRSTLDAWRNGLAWQVHEADWSDDTELTLGALTAGEEALMAREMPEAADADERRLWYVAAATETGPYVDDDLEATFQNVAGLPPGVVKYLEARANSLGIVGDEGNASSKSSPATDSEAPSPQPPDSTT